MSILPIPTSRVSDYLVRSRLVQQSQSDQLEIFRLQNQISTGRRIVSPSDDGPAALRAITLQRGIERKEQLQINLRSSQAALTAAESSLTSVGSVMNDIRAEAVAVAGTTSTDEERQTTRTSVLTTLDRLVTLANSSYQENYLFAGARSLSPPYVVVEGGYVEYRGDERNQQQRVDTGVLFDVNVPGDEVFGGLSEAVRGVADLNPQLTLDTPLSSLRGGDGVAVDGAIEIAYFPHASVVEAETATIDLSSARTVGDVVRLIETGGPPSANLRVGVTANGLQIETEPGAATPGSIAVRDLAGGTTAKELRIDSDTPATVLTGQDLNPQLRLTTKLDALLGAKSAGRIELPGPNNDFSLTAAANGAAFNGTEVSLVAGATFGSESAVFTPGAPPTLVVTVADGESTAKEVVAAINAEGTFDAEIDYRDALSTLDVGTAVVNASGTPVGTTDAGGAGTSLDLASGLLVTNGESPVAIDTSTAQTVEDLLNTLNKTETGLIAVVNDAGTGIDIRSRRSGADFSIGENGGTLAQQLGVRTTTAGSKLEDFNRGAGVLADSGGPNANVMTIVVEDNGSTTTHEVDLAGATTVNDVLAAIAADTGGAVSASLATTGNGITLSTGLGPVAPATADGTYTLGADTLTITADTAGFAGNQTFDIAFVDSGTGGLSTDVTDNTITVDLGGAGSQTDLIAASISGALAGFSVVSSGTAAVATTDPVVGAPATQATTAGGVDASPAGADRITVSGEVAGRLGFFSGDASSATTTTDTITSADVNTIEVDSVFNSLLRLADALERGDKGVPDVGEAITRLDDDLDRATNARGEIGSRVRSLNTLQYRLEDEEVELRSSLSDEIDVDLTEAISDFTARQYSLQASLQSTASILQLSLLDFL